MEKDGELKPGQTPCEQCEEVMSDVIVDGIAMCSPCARLFFKPVTKPKKIQKTAEDLSDERLRY